MAGAAGQGAVDQGEAVVRGFSRGQILSSAATLASGAVLAQVCMASATLLAGRELGPSRFGEYAACFSATSLAAIVFNLGLDNWLMRYASEHDAPAGQLLATAVRIKFGAGLPWLAAVVIFLPLLNPATFHRDVVLVSALTTWLEGFFSLMLVCFKALLRNRTTSALLLLSRGGMLAFTVLLAALHLGGVLPFAGARLAAELVAVGVTARLLPFQWTKKGPLAGKGQTVKESLPFALSDFFTSIYVQADVTIAALLLTKEAVGLYSPASSLINAAFVIPSALYWVALPALVRVHRASTQRFKERLLPTLAGFAALGGVLSAAVWSTAAWLPALLLGRSFQESGALLAILSPILLLKSCSYGAAAILVVVGWQGRRNYVQIASAVANVGLNLAVISRAGIAGVARVYVASELLLAVGYLALVYFWARQKHLETEDRSFGSHG